LLLLRGQQVMSAGDSACALTESFSTENFTPNGADEFLADAVTRPSE
jgi:hypothetical protein